MIPLFKIHTDQDDIDMVTGTIKRGSHWAIGPNIETFEKMLAEYIGTRYALTFNSGTSALHSLLLAYDIGRGDEVIVPSFTFIATANAPLFVGAKPVFADIERQTFGLDPEDVERKITPKTKAIIPINYAGCPCQIEELKAIADRHNVLLFEDAAEAFGAEVGGQKVGSFGDSSVLSFCANKIITTGEGGAVVTNSTDIYVKLKLIRSHGRADTMDYFSNTEVSDYVQLGYNFRMSDITAALGIAQLRKVDWIIRRRRNNSYLLTDKLLNIKEVQPPMPMPNPPVFQMYTILTNNRDKLQSFLKDKGIMSKVYFSPVHQTTFYKKYKVSLPVTEGISNQVLTLPMYPDLTEDEIGYITDCIKEFYGE